MIEMASSSKSTGSVKGSRGITSSIRAAKLKYEHDYPKYEDLEKEQSNVDTLQVCFVFF